MKDLLQGCDAFLRAAKGVGAAAAEAIALREAGGSVDIEKGRIGGAGWEESIGYGLRVIVGGRVGFAYATTPEQAAETATAAVRAARLGKARRNFTFAAKAATPSVAGLYDARVANVDADALLGHAREVTRALTSVRKDLVAVMGGIEAGTSEFAIATSEGLATSQRGTGIGGHVYTVQRKKGVSTGFASRHSRRLDLDWKALGVEAGRLAVESANAKALPKGGSWDCILRPEPASDLLSTVTIPSLYGKPAHRGESYYSGKKGKRVMSDKLSLTDDATTARGLGSTPFDDEGTPTKPVRLVDRGVLRTFLYDREDAAEWKARSTGNAQRSHAFDGRSYKSPPSTAAHQIRVDAPQATTAKLVAGLDDGLLIHDLMGVHTANTTSGDFSVNSSVLFRIRKGEVVGAVKPVSVAGNVHAVLQRGLRLGDDVKPMGGEPAWALPSVFVGGLSVTL